MIITKDLIDTIVDMYTVDEIREKIVALVNDLETNGSTIVSASTGAGASYTRHVEASREDLLNLYQAALNKKLGRPARTGSIGQVAFVSSFNR